jgi:hypothetical protein
MTDSGKAVDEERACCVCPYCDVDLEEPLPSCLFCGSQLRYCAVCGTPVKKEEMVCPNCGSTRVVKAEPECQSPV